MPFPLKADHEKRQAFGISLDRRTVDRLDVLLGIRPGKRSEQYRELLIEGIERRYGADWASKADRLLEGVAA